MPPQVSVGALSQSRWPGAGDVDDCWAVADLQAILATAPWLELVGIPKYREAAGNPDLPGPTGGSIADSRRAISTLYPLLQVTYFDATPPRAWVELKGAIQGGRVASVQILSGALPPALRFGFAGVHRIAVFWIGAWRILNPLQAPHARPLAIGEDALRTAIQAGSADGVRAVIMPTASQAFDHHPLLAGAIDRATAALELKITKAAAAIAAAEAALKVE